MEQRGGGKRELSGKIEQGSTDFGPNSTYICRGQRGTETLCGKQAGPCLLSVYSRG